MPFLKHKLGKTYYLKKGTNKKEIVFCLHGGPGGDHRLMKPLLKLSDKYTVVMYDQLGSGKNPQTSKSKWDVKTFVKELDLLIEKLGYEKVTLFGASWGTTLALEYYLKHPKKVKRIIFQSPMFSAFDWQKDAKRLIKKMSTNDRKVLEKSFNGEVDPEAFQKSMFKYYLTYVLRNKKVLEELFKSGISEGGKKIYAYMWGASEFNASGTLKRYNRVKMLKKITIPTLFICGQYDEATPETVKRYAKMLKGAKLKVIRGGSHVLSHEKPRELIKAVRNFIEFT